jgi:hypothetical protein
VLLDLRYAFRKLPHAPGFAVAVILTLALAIGTVTAIFSVADAILFRALPYPVSNRLVMVWDRLLKFGQDRFPLREETCTAYWRSQKFSNRPRRSGWRMGIFIVPGIRNI